MADWLDGYFENKRILESTLNIPMQRTVSAVRVALVEPAATFTSATPSSAAAGADTLLTSAGVHGLTGAVSVGASIYISGGTGWTVGFHAITAIAVNTTGVTIQIGTPYDASMGIPTIALANTEVTSVTIAIPPLFENSHIDLDLSYAWTSSANNKIIRVKYGGTTFFSRNVSTSGVSRTSICITNRGITNSQISGMGTGDAAGFGTATVVTTTGSVDSSLTKNLLVTVQPSAANELVTIDRYVVFVWR